MEFCRGCGVADEIRGAGAFGVPTSSDAFA